MAKRGDRWRRAGRARAALALLALAACASSGAAAKWRGGRFVEPAHGGEIGDLAALEPGWRAEPQPDAALAYRHVDGTSASWMRDCRGVEAGPRALARALWLALPEAEIEEERGLEVAGAPGWRLTGSARSGAALVRIESVTRVSPRCADSWLLVGPHAELHHREAFAAWWSGFRDARGDG